MKKCGVGSVDKLCRFAAHITYSLFTITFYFKGRLIDVPFAFIQLSAVRAQPVQLCEAGMQESFLLGKKASIGNSI